MSSDEAKQNIGAPFKYSLSSIWDVIIEVTEDGFIVGEFLEAPVEDCRLKMEMPAGLLKYKQTKNEINNNV